MINHHSDISLGAPHCHRDEQCARTVLSSRCVHDSLRNTTACACAASHMPVTGEDRCVRECPAGTKEILGQCVNGDKLEDLPKSQRHLIDRDDKARRLESEWM